MSVINLFKYTDDVALVGLLTHNDGEALYREEIEGFYKVVH